MKTRHRPPSWMAGPTDEAWSVVLACTLLALSTIEIVVATIGMVVDDLDWGFALVGGLCSAMVAIPYLVTRLSVFSLWGPVTLVVALGTGVRGLSMATGWPDATRVGSLFLLGRHFEDFVWPSVVTVLSVAGVVGGYICMRRVTLPSGVFRRIRDASSEPDDPSDYVARRVLVVVAAYAAAGLLGTALYLESVGGLSSRISERRTIYDGSTNFQSFGQWEYLAKAGAIALILYLAYVLRRGRRLGMVDWLILGVLAANAFAINWITTTRTDLLYITLGALLIVHAVRGRIPLRLLAGCGVAVVLGIGLLSGIRASSEQGDALMTGLSSSVLNRNGYDLSKTIQIIDAVPERLPHAYGMTVARYAIAPVPRALWPTKPAISEGVEVGKKVYGLTVTGIPPGVTAELVWDFGRVLAVILSFVVGLGFGALERLSMKWMRHNAALLVASALIVVPLGKAVMGVSMGQAVSAAGQWFVLLVPLLFAVRWIRPRQPETGGTRAAPRVTLRSSGA